MDCSVMGMNNIFRDGIILRKFIPVITLCCLSCLNYTRTTSATTTSNDIFYFEIKENSLPNTYVGKIVTKPGFSYRFNDEPTEFQLDSKTGVIVTTDVPTDRETKSFYNLVILSSSPTYPLEVKIKILDVNDNIPHWPSYINTNLSFSESAPIGTKIIIDTAIDLDDGHLQYQINYNDNTHDMYTINNNLPFKLSYNISSSFLHLEVSDKLDREAQSSYIVNISAIDEGFKSSSVLFYVKILDSNDNPPIFDHSDYSVSLNESIGKDVSILQVRATDSDEEGNENSRISYYLLSDEYFNIDPNTGIIFTAQEAPINCGTVTAESNTDYWKVCVFTVFAHDYGTPRQDGRTYVTAKIYDSNNHSPSIKFRYFSRSEHASVDENAANGSVVAAVSVVDLDHGLNGQTTLEIADGDKFGHFRLDSIGNSHIIRVNGSLDRERMSSYNLTISAYDHGSPTRSSSAYLIIVVYDHNDHSPKFSRDVYETTITESQHHIGLYVSSLRASDLDEGINSNLFYSLSGPNSHYFKIDQITGLITTDKIINREEIDLFELRVTARDGGSNPKWAHTILKVKVLDVNDEIPSIKLPKNSKYDNKTKSYSLEVEENTFLNITLVTVDNDLGVNGTVDLSLLYDYNGLFQIEESSKRLLSTKILDYEECDSFKLLIVAKDRGLKNHQLSSTTTVFIKVKDKDDISPVVYPKIYYSFVPLNQKSFNYSIVVSRVSIKDSDFQTPINFVIHGHNELVPQMFSLSRNGEIKLRSSANLRTLNKNFPNLVKFNVGCNGCQKEFNDSQINIYLINSEMNSLSREIIKREYSFDIREDELIGSVVGRIDIDTNKYRLYIVSGDIYNQFVIIKNIIKTNKLIDRESKDNYKLQIIAANNQYFFHIDVNVNIIDVNDCHPLFYDKFVELTINEDSPPKLSVYKLEAYDPDVLIPTSNQLKLPRYDKSNNNFIEYKLISNPFNLFFIQKSELKLAKSITDFIDRSISRQSDTLNILKIEIIAVDKQLEANKTSIYHFSNNINSDDSQLSKCKLDNRLTIFMRIKSMNRYNPRFNKPFYEISISESMAVNEHFLKINAIDDDGDAIGYQIKEGNTNNTFGIFPDGNLYVKNPLDREMLDVFSLRIEAFEINHRSGNGGYMKGNDLSISCQVLIHIIDVNDNKPQFLNNTFNFMLSENSPINTLIGQVVAFDEDSGSNSEIYYSIVNSYYSSSVEIDPFSGYIWSKTRFDRETLPFFEILVQAMDQPIDEDKFSSQALIRIDILDVNDNYPIFEVPINVTLRPKNNNDLFLFGDLLVSEDLKVDSTLATFKASDMDSNATIMYEISNCSHSDYFLLNETTGVLKLRKELDRESIEQFILIIEANDGKFRSYFKLNIILEDVNDCPPMWINFTHHEISIPENISIGSEIIKLSASDLDIGINGLFHFEITSSGNKKYFDILKQSIVVVNKLDYETEKVHHLNLTIVDEMGLRSNVEILKVLIQDVNDCTPIFSQRSDSEVIRVSENIEIGAKLLTLQAFDCDVGDVLVYEIISCNTHYQTRKKSLHAKQAIEIRHKHDSNNCPLKIDSKNGEIMNINSLDRELIESINLKVSVKDSVGHSDKKKLIFLIDDINDEKPLFISPNKIIIRKEFKRENMPIGLIEAIDLDIGINSVITYKMEASDFSSYLHLDSHSGQLTTKKAFDNNISKKFMINVVAADGSGLATSDNITFIILPSNMSDLNVLTKNIAIDIFENEPLGTHITKLQCSDNLKLNKPFNSSHVISLCEFHIINSTDRTFAVDSQSGHIYSNALIDREIRDKYLLEVLIIGKYSLEKMQVIINVLDQNDNPPYLKNTSVSVHISESSHIDLEVFDLSKLIADEDTNNKFDFQIINCSTCDDGLFLLNRKTGIISLKSRLDREKVDQYRILFGVSDGIYLLTSALDIYVDDENDNSPSFNSTLYTFDIEENTNRGVLVGQIFAFDKDINQQLIYSIIADKNPINSIFNLNARNGEFTLTKHLDYEIDPKQYTLTCEASDGTFKSERIKVVFNLINLPDNPPLFDQPSYKIEIFENVSLSKIMCVSATDADNSDLLEQYEKKQFKLMYYFDSDSEKPQLTYENFEIDSKSGCISIKTSLDREKKSLYEMVVIADDATFKANANVQIKVLDVNDNYPVFDRNTPNILKVAENSAIDSIVYAFKATDLDEAPNNYVQYEIVYKVLSDNSQTLPFSIGPIDGLLKITGLIDKEAADSFSLIVRANDYGLKSSEIEVLIEIIDVIDNAPQFEQTEVQVNVYENASIDDIVIKLLATDLDQTDKIHYRIVSGDLYGHFKINDDYIVVAMQLDFEQIQSFDLKVNAIDKGGNLDTANVKINVVNVLDEVPYFFNSPYSINWCENEIGIIGQFEAILEKLDSNQHNPNSNRVNYLLINNYEQYFSLNSTNAVLSVIKPIDRESLNGKPEIELRIIAIDSRSPRLTGEGVIHLNIYDVNDNEPYFSQSEYKIALNENQIYDANKPIGSVIAFDKDVSDQITYHIIEDSETLDKFAMNASNGKIYVKSNSIFDREIKDTFEIKVSATDSKFQTQAKIIITINDVNDCTPKIVSINNQTIPFDKTNIEIIIPFIKLNSLLQNDFLLFGLRAIDCDLDGTKNSQIRFQLNSSANNYFKMDQTNGVVKAEQRITQITNPVTIDLTAMDSPDINPLSSSVKINLKIINDKHYKESLLIKPPPKALTVSELSKLNQTVYKFEPIFSNVQIDLIGGDPREYFTIQNNLLIINRYLDYEKIKDYHLYIEAFKKFKDYNEFQQIKLHLNVINENDLPPKFDFDLYNATILEEVDETILVTQVIATDIDSDGPNSEVIKYKIISPTNAPFRIDENFGKIWTTSKIDREVNSEFNLIVMAEDEGGLSSTCKVHITVDDKNDNPPRFTRLFRANITENAAIGTFVIQVTSSDKDLGPYSQATYNFLGHSDVFDIDPYSGKVFVTGNLDREVKEEYLLLVSANDGSWKAQTTLTINILDENDSTPKFNKNIYEFHKTVTSEIASSHSNIGTVKAIDADKGVNAIITYNLKHKSQYFSINSQTGEIAVKKMPKLYYESDLTFLNRHTLTVIAVDKGQLPKSSEVSVFINMFPQQIRKESQLKPNYIKIAIPYDLKNNTILYSTTSSDIKLDNIESNILSIDSNKLIFNGESVVKSGKSYKFIFSINSDKIEVELYITEPNLFTPLFVSNQKQIIVPENEILNQIIFDGRATDNDSDNYNNLISYEFNVSNIIWNNKAIHYLKQFHGKDNHNLFSKDIPLDQIVQNIKLIKNILNPFIINPTNGTIYLNSNLDFEIITAYSLTITASDNGWFGKNSSLQINIIISDVSDDISSSGTDSLDSDLVTSSLNPDPMSIGVILVITFFLILILVISTSFLIFHNQKKNQIRECNTNQRKVTGSIKHYLSATPTPPSTLVQPQPSIQSTPVHTIPPRLPSKQPDVVSPISVPPVERTRPVPPAVPPSFIHSHSDNFNDNYSNILATAEHYDLENASSIAPSDIDIVYHYKGYRNRDSLPLHHRHAPLARLSPSVSELSSMPRILTLQDLSPQVPPCPPVTNRTNKPKTNDNSNDDEEEDNSNENSNENSDENSDDSFTCSEFDENYDMSKKDKNMIFQRVW